MTRRAGLLLAAVTLAMVLIAVIALILVTGGYLDDTSRAALRRLPEDHLFCPGSTTMVKQGITEADQAVGSRPRRAGCSAPVPTRMRY